MTHPYEERTCSGPLRMPMAEHRVEARLLSPRTKASGKGCVHLTCLRKAGISAEDLRTHSRIRVVPTGKSGENPQAHPRHISRVAN